MIKCCFAAALFFAIAAVQPACAQSDSAGLQAEDDQACAAQGTGPGASGYDDCLVQRKQTRIRQTQARAALMKQPIGDSLASTPMDAAHMYLAPEGIHALENAPPARPAQTVTTTRVCVTEGDKDSAPICRTEVDTSKKAARSYPAGPLNDPLSAQRSDDIFHARTQY